MTPRSIPRATPLVLAAALLLSACADRLPSAASPEAAGPLLTVIPVDSFTTIDAGRNHTCGLTASGQGICWGRNNYGQLGDSTAAPTTTPVSVYHPSGVTFDRVTGAGSHTCALTGAGQAYCWGYNADGRLGDSTFFNPLMPVAVLPLGGIAFDQVSGGGAHTCGIDAGQAYCWGYNGFGQLGDNTISFRLSPVAVQQPAGVSFTHVETGENHTCALDSNGKAYCWGYGGDSQIGNGSTLSRRVPTAVSQPAGVTFVKLSSTYKHACGLTSGGQAYCWGDNPFGQLGDSTVVDRSTPVAVQQPAGVTFAGIAAGGNATCAWTSAGQAYCWGDDTYGQIGNGAAAGNRIPVAVSQPAGVAFGLVVADHTHACGLDGVGQTWCWGRNNYGQVGDGTSTNRNVPTATSH